MKNTKLIKLVAGFMAATFSLSLLTTRVEAKNIENKNTKNEVKQTVNSKDLERKLIGYFPEWHIIVKHKDILRLLICNGIL